MSKHGTESRYVNGCRCKSCAKVGRKVAAERMRARRAEGLTIYDDAGRWAAIKTVHKHRDEYEAFRQQYLDEAKAGA